MTIGGVGMYAVSVVLPQIQAEFGVTRSDASLPCTLTMIGFGLGGILMGRRADRHGIVPPLILGGGCLSIGFIAAGMVGKLRIHDLRRSTASYLAMTSASGVEIAEILGHKTLQMVTRYSHLSDSHARGVVEKMNREVIEKV